MRILDNFLSCRVRSLKVPPLSEYLLSYVFKSFHILHEHTIQIFRGHTSALVTLEDRCVSRYRSGAVDVDLEQLFL